MITYTSHIISDTIQKWHLDEDRGVVAQRNMHSGERYEYSPHDCICD